MSLPDHDFPIGEKHKLIASVYAGCIQKETGPTYSGPTYVAIRSAKHDTSSSKTHARDFETLKTLESFRDIMLHENEVKPLVFVGVDGGPDESPSNLKAMHAWYYI